MQLFSFPYVFFQQSYKLSHYPASDLLRKRLLVQFFYWMDKEVLRLKIELTRRLYALHQQKFGGNNVHLANAAGCGEATVRNIFAKLKNQHSGQDITIGMAFRLCYALDVSLSDLVKGLDINPESTKKQKN